MRYREYLPSEPARELVACYWTMDADSPSLDTTQRIVPDGQPELIVNLGEAFEQYQDGQWRRQPSRVVAGQINRPMLIRPTGRIRVLGARFQPWGLARISTIPMSEIAGSIWPIEDALPTLANLDQLGRIDREIRRLAEAHPADGIVEAMAAIIKKAGGQIRIGDLAARAGLSARQFDRRFLNRVGLPPKTFCRIQRFQRVFEGMAGPLAKWADVAISCGYYDQAHLIRDFQDFAGEAPSVLMRDSSDLARHFLMSHSSKTPRTVSV